MKIRKYLPAIGVSYLLFFVLAFVTGLYSPLGVIVYDSGGLETYVSLPTPYLETADGRLGLCHSSGLSYYDDDGVMHQIEFHFASESIDLESVTAIVFDGQRIEIP